MKTKAYVHVTIDPIPQEDGDEFYDWCDTFSCKPLNSSRRAWCNEFNTYVRHAIGIATSPSGEHFLLYPKDLVLWHADEDWRIEMAPFLEMANKKKETSKHE